MRVISSTRRRATNKISVNLFTLILGLTPCFFPLSATAAPTTQSTDDASTTAPDATASDADRHVPFLIADLSSDDAAKRQAAADALVKIGAPARPAILKLVKSDDPSVRGQAAQILLMMPWELPTDSADVKKILAAYSDTDITKRRMVILGLADLPDQAGIEALKRLFVEEPSDDVRWSIAAALRTFADGPSLAHFRDADPPAGASAPAIAMAGYAWLEFDLTKSAALLNRCAEMEFAQPSDDDGEFDFVIKTLAEILVSTKKFDDAAVLRRKEYARGCHSDETGLPIAIVELFALHGDYGPLKGFDDDVKLAGSAYQSAKIQYALSRMYARTGDATKADAARAAAFSASNTQIARYHTGSFLFDHGWDDLARKELEEFLKTPRTPGDDAEIMNDTANVHFRLAGLAIKREDDFTAAQEKESAMRILGSDTGLTRTDGRGHQMAAPGNDIWADIYFRYYRAAIAKGDTDTAAQRLSQLIAMKPTDPDIAIDVIPGLKKRGLTDDAKSLFRSAYSPLKAKLDADPDNPSLMNEIAWTCAKCDEHLDEALQLATKTVAAQPENAAVIDTLAEVNFHLGHAEEAVRLETKASSLRPDDPFMKEQLKRFKGEPTTQPSTN